MEKHLNLKRAILCAAIVLIVGIFSIAPISSASAQSESDLSGFVGRWQINLSKTILNRKGPNAKYTPRPATYTNVFSVQGQNLKMDVFNQYPQAAPNRSTNIVADEKERVCKAGCLEGAIASDESRVETHAYFKIDSHMLVRLTHLNGKVSEYMAFGLSTDGKTMTQVIWSPETPEWQSVYVYDKEQ